MANVSSLIDTGLASFPGSLLRNEVNTGPYLSSSDWVLGSTDSNSPFSFISYTEKSLFNDCYHSLSFPTQRRAFL